MYRVIPDEVTAEHVRDHGLQAEPDEVNLEFAREHGYVVVSEDTDFGELLARQATAAPSFVLLRTNGPMQPDEHVALCLRTSRVSNASWTGRGDRAGLRPAQSSEPPAPATVASAAR
ncbi:DUF5615 family PIN-like protein [Pseudonocardia sp. Cha107L01]|uniref:DUF5615 family PIN-like protein n=1 Tax=Pseudonocardia sp. Cha107L01 TaxID=3457576 RepID=UPI00403EB2FA